jgi:hypothetical protein
LPARQIWSTWWTEASQRAPMAEGKAAKVCVSIIG